jgi:hypothetical protein
MSLASVALASAREYMNDSAGQFWTDAVLMPKLQEAHRQMQVRLQLAGIPVIKTVSTVLTVPARTTDLTTVAGYPADLVEPKWLKSRNSGQRNSDFVDMTQCDYIPNWDMGTSLGWWCWQGEKILLLGSTIAKEVQLRYVRGLAVPTTAGSSLGFIYAENFLGPKTAALAATATENASAVQEWAAEAEKALTDIIRMNIRGLQNLPAKRQAYHRGRHGAHALRGS